MNMECLGVPIDHRLRRLIRGAKRIDKNNEEAGHLQLLHDFGTSFEVDGSDYPIYDLSFGLEMARPTMKGGVIVVLERPYSTQENSDGFMEGVRKCRTIDAVSDLICHVNNHKLRFDDVSVFDMIPFLDETVTGPEEQSIIDEAKDVFADMVRAKEPDVILCCAKTETDNPLVKKLQTRGIGRSFYANDLELNEPGLSSVRVNAFHPSYAVNRYPMFCCFGRLLVLEFTKAFALCRQVWTEEPWMRDLRFGCRKRAKCNFDESNADGEWDFSYLESRWEDLLECLDEQIEKCLFLKEGEVLSPDIQHQLVESKITWLSCDIAWILEQLERSEIIILGIPQYLLASKLEKWALNVWPADLLHDQLDPDSGNACGYFSHVPLLTITSNQPNALIRSLENKFFAFLRDLNLSISWNKGFVIDNALAQACAFRRFAAAFEDILEEIMENGVSNDEAEINHNMGSLSLN